MALIEALTAREILDSRGNPTVEVEVLLEDGLHVATGGHQANAQPGRDQVALERDQLIDRGRIGLQQCHSISVVGLGSLNHIHQALKPERKTEGRHVLAQESANHPVVATSAAE